MQDTKALKDSIKLAQELGFKAINAIRDKDTKDLQNIVKDMIQRDF